MFLYVSLYKTNYFSVHLQKKMPQKGELKYHIVWCPKYRRKVLTGKVEQRLKELLIEKCKNNNYEVIELEIMPDHVHLFLKASGKDSVHRIVSQLKGYTSHVLRKEFLFLNTRLPNLWTRSYYAGSVGNMSEDTVKKYIQNQKRHS